jgi:hypothetical protein
MENNTKHKYEKKVNTKLKSGGDKRKLNTERNGKSECYEKGRLILLIVQRGTEKVVFNTKFSEVGQ